MPYESVCREAFAAKTDVSQMAIRVGRIHQNEASPHQKERDLIFSTTRFDDPATARLVHDIKSDRTIVGALVDDVLPGADKALREQVADPKTPLSEIAAGLESAATDPKKGIGGEARGEIFYAAACIGQAAVEDHSQEMSLHAAARGLPDPAAGGPEADAKVRTALSMEQFDRTGGDLVQFASLREEGALSASARLLRADASGSDPRLAGARVAFRGHRLTEPEGQTFEHGAFHDLLSRTQSGLAQRVQDGALSKAVRSNRIEAGEVFRVVDQRIAIAGDQATRRDAQLWEASLDKAIEARMSQRREPRRDRGVDLSG